MKIFSLLMVTVLLIGAGAAAFAEQAQPAAAEKTDAPAAKAADAVKAADQKPDESKAEPAGQKPEAPADKSRTAGKAYPEFGVGLLENAGLADLGPDVLATVNGKQITRKYLEAKVAEAPEEYRKLFEKTRGFLLAQLVQREIILAEAKKQGLVKEGDDEKAENKGIYEVIGKQLKAIEVTDAELKEAYEKHKDADLGGAKFEDVKEKVQEAVLRMKQQEAMVKLLKEISKDVNVVVDDKFAAEQNKQITDNPVDKARASGKVSMVEFGAEWCPPCKQMAPILKELADECKDANIVQIDVDKEETLAMRFFVQQLPTIVFFNATGHEAFRKVGPMTKKEILAKFDEIKKQANAPEKK